MAGCCVRWLALALALILSCGIAGAVVGSLEARSGAGAAPPQRTPRLSLVVFEADNCVYCPVLRQSVIPRYQGTAFDRAAPLSFVNLSQDGNADRNADAPVTVVPTAVLFANGREIDRYTGFVGTDDLLASIARHIADD